MAFSVYLPSYLKTAYDLTAADAANRMAGFVVVAVLMRPIGGWLSDRFGPIPVLATCYAVVVAGAAVAATTPLLEHVGTVAFLSMAAALGGGSGATFALVAKVTDPARVGGVTGLVGAAGGLGGFVPPLIMGYVYGRTQSYGIGLMLLSDHRGLDAAADPDDREKDRPTRPGRSTAPRPARELHEHWGSSRRTTAGDRPGRGAQRGAGPHPALLHQGPGLGRPAHPAQDRRPRRRRLLPGPLEPRQGRPLDPRRELHRLLLVEGVRQGRHHHLGDPADRLSVGRPGQAGVRAPRLSARRRLLLVHLLPHADPLPLHPRRAAADVPRGQGPVRRSGRRLGAHRRQSYARTKVQVRPWQGRPGAGDLGRGHRARRRRLRAHAEEVGTGPDRRASRRSRRCRWCRTPPAPGSPR